MSSKSNAAWAGVACGLLLGMLNANVVIGKETGNQRASLKVGQLAPTFTLKSLDGKQSFSLRDQRTKKPVVLFFGSYT